MPLPPSVTLLTLPNFSFESFSLVFCPLLAVHFTPSRFYRLYPPNHPPLSVGQRNKIVYTCSIDASALAIFTCSTRLRVCNALTSKLAPHGSRDMQHLGSVRSSPSGSGSIFQLGPRRWSKWAKEVRLVRWSTTVEPLPRKGAATISLSINAS